MITIKKKTECCGCSACTSACPVSCIRMVADQEGFMSPYVDETQCIDCHKCEKVCPIAKEPLNQTVSKEKDKTEITKHAIDNEPIIPQAYVGYLKNDKIRQLSTSGGFFRAVSDFVIANNGAVFGVVVDDDMHIKHIMAETADQIEKIQGSKYVQSSQDGIYKNVESQLKTNRMVLYTGTPCQVAGLQSYLRREYANLITIDIFCHGVGSPLYWKQYVMYMQKKYHSKIQKVFFREKTYGYNSACLAVYFQNGKSSHKDHDTDLFWSAFSKNYVFRPTCYNCHFKSIKHKYSDFTIGDYWDTSDVGDDYLKANGCSLLLVQSEKGREIMKKLKDTMAYIQVDLLRALLINGGWQPSKLITSAERPNDRQLFLSTCENAGIEKAVKTYLPLSFKKKLKCTIKPMLYRIGALEKIKKLRG